MAGGCDRCDGPGGEKTYANQAGMPINGRVRSIDWCIHRIVAALNAANIPTVASCCGHRESPGDILLEDGRCLVIFEGITPGEKWMRLRAALEAAGLSPYDRSENSQSSR